MTSSGWVSYTTTTNLLNPMQGYAANFGSVAIAKLWVLRSGEQW